MKLEKVLKGIEVLGKLNFKSFEIKGIATNSKKLNGANLFVCQTGMKFNSHNEMKKIENNIDVFIVEEFNPNISKTQIKVSKTSNVLSKILLNFNKLNKIKIKFIGVTGTNGKTTTTYYVKHILENAGKNVALMGTNGCFINNKKYETQLTTPEIADFVSLLKIMIKAGVEYLVMEVSAHAIMQERLKGINFEVSAFTNLTQDHLDDFSSIYEYAYHKFSFIRKSKFAVINIDDKFGAEFSKVNKVTTISKSKKADAQFSVKNNNKLILNIEGKKFEIETSVLPDYNFYNLVLAISVCLKIGIELSLIKSSLKNLPKVEGRYNLFNLGNRLICIDYAHTPDAIDKILIDLKKIKKDLIVVFGASGFRDATKREAMGKIASKYAKLIILTADNPRFENVSQINEQIGALIKVPYVSIPNREDAIKYAIEVSKANSIIALLGKGNEEHQDICAKLVHHNDYETCLKIFNEQEFNGDKNE